MRTNTLISPTMVAAQTLLMLCDRHDDVPASASAVVDLDMRDLTLTMSEYADKVLVPVVGKLSDATSLDRRPLAKPIAQEAYRGMNLAIWELYDIRDHLSRWWFRVIRT